MNSRERIMKEALRLFSRKGYSAVSVREIADAVGMKAPSLYKHFRSKKDIFDSIICESNERYETVSASLALDGGDPDHDAPLFSSLTPEDLSDKVRSLFVFFLHDEFASSIRRMLMIESQGSSELASLCSRLYFDYPLSYQKKIFTFLTSSGILEGDPGDMALEFYAPIYTLLLEADRRPERESELLSLLSRHVMSFGVRHGGRR